MKHAFCSSGVGSARVALTSAQISKAMASRRAVRMHYPPCCPWPAQPPRARCATKAAGKSNVAGGNSAAKRWQGLWEFIKSAIFPCGAALFEKGPDTLGGVARQHVLDHHLACVAVGIGEVKLQLAIECLLADLDHVLGLGGNLLRQLQRLEA